MKKLIENYSGTARGLLAILNLQTKTAWFKREKILRAFTVGDLQDHSWYAEAIGETLESIK